MLSARSLFALLPLLLAAAPAAAQESSGGDAPRAVAARDLDRGEVLTAADVTYDPPAPVGSAAGRAPVGWVTRRTIAAGEALRHPAVAPPQLIRSGEAVQLLWERNGVRVGVRGTALGSAAEGERVSVRVDARRRFEGIAVGKGLVRMDAN